jgi:hypothetical protein
MHIRIERNKAIFKNGIFLGVFVKSVLRSKIWKVALLRSENFWSWNRTDKVQNSQARYAVVNNAILLYDKMLTTKVKILKRKISELG